MRRLFLFSLLLMAVLVQSACSVATSPSPSLKTTPTVSSQVALNMKTASVSAHIVRGPHFPHRRVASDNNGQDKRSFQVYPTGAFRPRTTTDPPTKVVPGHSLLTANQHSPLSQHALPAALPARSLDPVNLVLNTSLGAQQDSKGAFPFRGEETSAASNGTTVFMTGNWFDALSTDGGSQFTAIDATTLFPNDDGGFCCDQVVEYSPQIDRFFWLILYSPNGTNENRLRLAVASTGDLVQSGGTAWSYYDLSSSVFGLSQNWLDFPDMVVAGQSLSITANVIGRGGALMTRIPLAALGRGANISVTYFTWDQNTTLRLARNCGSRLFWASINTTSQIRVFAWDEGTNTVLMHDVDVSSWNNTEAAC